MSGDGDKAFERALREELPRGQKNREDSLPRTVWAEASELGEQWNYTNDGQGLFLGYRNNRELGWCDDRHALTVAGTRAGKGTGLIIPNLLRYSGSVLAMDPKGELVRVTGRQRAEIGDLVVLDPFGENGVWPTGQYNPLDELDPNGKEVIDEAGAIADALVIYSGQGDPHWCSAARGLLRALILMVLDFPKEERNLVTVRELLMLTHPALTAATAAMNKVARP